MLLYIGLALVAIILLILAMAASKPDTFQIHRSTVVNAPADRVFPRLNDFREWQSWSPWEGIDPALQRTYSGPASGTGTMYAWKGNKKVGSGSMEITSSTAPTQVVIDLHFIEPFEARNVTEFALVPQGPATGLTWTMRGRLPFQMKIMRVFMNMDKLI